MKLILITLAMVFTIISEPEFVSGQTYTQPAKVQSLGGDWSTGTNYSHFSVAGEPVVKANFSQGVYSGHIGFIFNAENLNQPPIANAGLDATVYVGALITLNGSGSYDPDNNPITYHWSGPAEIVLSNYNASNPTFTAPYVNVSKVYTFTLIVNDGQENSLSDAVNITVLNPNWIPVIYPNSTIIYATVTMDGLPASAGDIVGAFVNNECRGVDGVEMYLGNAWAIFNIQGSVPETVNFKVYDASQDLICDVAGSTTTIPGGEIGSYVQPYQIASECAAPLQLSLKVFMEGPFNGTNMNTNLNANGLIPLTQPFNVPPWNYSGTESVGSIPNSNVVDWILIELRETSGDASTATSSKRIARQAVFLLNNGSLVDIDGTSNIQMNLIITQNLFVVIWQRNHLAIMNANPLIASGGIYNYDFTTGSSQSYGGNLAVKQLNTGIWGMYSGDGNANNSVETTDKTNIWKNESGQKGYKSGDFNLNGQVNNPDKNNYWLPNIGKQSQIPN